MIKKVRLSINNESLLKVMKDMDFRFDLFVKAHLQPMGYSASYVSINLRGDLDLVLNRLVYEIDHQYIHITGSNFSLASGLTLSKHIQSERIYTRYMNDHTADYIMGTLSGPLLGEHTLNVLHDIRRSKNEDKIRSKQ